MPLNLVFKALSDPTRREILRMLQNSDLTAGEISDQFDMTKPSISHHLNVLKQSGLVQDLRKGQNICYSLNTTVFQELIGWFFKIAGSPEITRDVEEKVQPAVSGKAKRREEHDE